MKIRSRGERQIVFKRI